MRMWSHWTRRCNTFGPSDTIGRTSTQLVEDMSEATGAPQQHDRFDYSPIIDRPPLRWPNGARVAVWVIPNIEHFLFDRPSTSITHATTGLVPDVLNYSWRDYGVRVGIWRVMEVMEKHGFRGTVALNSEVCRHYPRIIDAGRELDWEWMGHGAPNSELIGGQAEDDERALIQRVVTVIAESTGERPRGWLSPGVSEGHRTLGVRAENGMGDGGNWVSDEQAGPVRGRTGSVVAR